MKTTQSDLAFTNVEFVHNHMALSFHGKIWYRSEDGDALSTAKVTVGD